MRDNPRQFRQRSRRWTEAAGAAAAASRRQAHGRRHGTWAITHVRADALGGGEAEQRRRCRQLLVPSRGDTDDRLHAVGGAAVAERARRLTAHFPATVGRFEPPPSSHPPRSPRWPPSGRALCGRRGARPVRLLSGVLVNECAGAEESCSDHLRRRWFSWRSGTRRSCLHRIYCFRTRRLLTAMGTAAATAARVLATTTPASAAVTRLCTQAFAKAGFACFSPSDDRIEVLDNYADGLRAVVVRYVADNANGAGRTATCAYDFRVGRSVFITFAVVARAAPTVGISTPPTRSSDTFPAVRRPSRSRKRKGAPDCCPAHLSGVRPRVALNQRLARCRSGPEGVVADVHVHPAPGPPLHPAHAIPCDSGGCPLLPAGVHDRTDGVLIGGARPLSRRGRWATGRAPTRASTREHAPRIRTPPPSPQTVCCAPAAAPALRSGAELIRQSASLCPHRPATSPTSCAQRHDGRSWPASRDGVVSGGR